jgi:hypothetical protein
VTKQIPQIVILLIVGAIIADFLTHGSITTSLASTFAKLANSLFSIASGQNAQQVS